MQILYLLKFLWLLLMTIFTQKPCLWSADSMLLTEK